MLRRSTLQLMKATFALLIPILIATSGYAQNQPALYGYFSTRLEKVFSEPSITDDAIIREDAPAEWSHPFFNIMLQHQINDKFKVFANLNGSGAQNIDVENFWGEYSVSELLNIRVGKIYRNFGLYNEILNAVPTYYGIEPPELFDGDHLILSRTTTFMLYGNLYAGPGAITYSLMTDNGEGDPNDLIPVGADLSYGFDAPGGEYLVGISGYTSGGRTNANVALGEGSPKSGVLPWMVDDSFKVFGGYAEGLIGNLTLQGAYWFSPHDAKRDPAKVVTVIESANPNAHQISRFLKDPNGPVEEANVNTDAEYDVETWYARAGYSFDTKVGEIGPYVQWDFYSNPETIQSKKYGGDNEAGLSDNGKFHKGTLGVVYRPIPEVAVKLDISNHFQTVPVGQTENHEDTSYPEVRFDISYIFGQ